MTGSCAGLPARRTPAVGRHVIFVALLAMSLGPACDRSESPAAREEAPDARTVLADTGGQTDNSACMVCHADFAEEPIAADHLEAGIVCASCHGASEDHGGDELNIITPDVTFGRSEIVSFCRPCHETHPTGESYDAFVEEWYGKRRPNGRMVLDNSVCTDCHGNHAILAPEQQIF
jgi:hypothetical protein